MALIKCSECGNMVSSMAPACTRCGCPTNKMELKSKFYFDIDKDINEKFFPIVLKVEQCVFKIDSTSIGKVRVLAGEISKNDVENNENILKVNFSHAGLFFSNDTTTTEQFPCEKIFLGADYLFICKPENSSYQTEDDIFFTEGINVELKNLTLIGSQNKRIIMNNGLLYEGEVFADVAHGYGIGFYENGATYEGYWLYGKRTGVGKMIYPNMGEWNGEFKDDKPWCGTGVFKYADCFFEGDIINGINFGKGKYIWDAGGEWVGEFHEGAPWSGKGVVRYSNATYKGTLENGKRHGKGQVTWENGEVWKGEFKEDEPWNGDGVYQYSNCHVKGKIEDGSTYWCEKTYF